MVLRTVFGLLVCAAVLAAGYVGWQRLSAPPPIASGSSNEQVDEGAPATDQIILSEQAQKNLELVAKPLHSQTFWKTITVPGMIVDQPGLSDREIVAPAVGTIKRLLHVPGDSVRPGDPLFLLQLTSEVVHQTQASLYRTTEELKLARDKRDRLASGGAGIPAARVIEVESEIAKLEASAKSMREELRLHLFSEANIEAATRGELVTELTVRTPPAIGSHIRAGDSSQATISANHDNETPEFAYEVQSLSVDLGQHVEAGQLLCRLSSHVSLAVEGRAFRDETHLLERSIANRWPVSVDFQEQGADDWPAIEQDFFIRYIANTIDPVTRTFAFLMPLENQFKEVRHGETTQLLWRFRPGQKVLLQVRVEKMENVFVMPADAVVTEGADAYVFTQNVNTFERKGVHLLHRDRRQAVIADDGSLPAYAKDGERRTIPAIVRTAAAQLNRMTKAGSATTPKGYHIHADGSLHKNESEAQ